MTLSILQQIKGRLVVSCQALDDEPLHSDFIMARMALAAEQGGAAAIRANGVEDVKAILRTVALPVIGIIKRDYAGSDVYITPTLREIDELMTAAPQMIALDATGHRRPGELQLAALVAADQTLLMTEKDAVKCRAFAQPNWWYLPVDAVLPSAQAEQLLQDIESLLTK